MHYLLQPYPADFAWPERLRVTVIFSFFVFIFLYIFEPFGLGTYSGNLFFVSLGYGLMCFISMFLLNIIFPVIFRFYFQEENWTIIKELLFTAANIFTVALANLYYSYLIGLGSMNLKVFGVFLFFTFTIGVFPISIFILLKQVKLQRQFETSSLAINNSIFNSKRQDNLTSKNNEEAITISSNNINEDLLLNSTDLLFIKSADNYIEVHFLKNNKPTKSIIRNSLKSVAHELVDNPQFFRCHKSFLVNMQRVISFSGNAQGYKLHLSGTDLKVPVSRKLNSQILGHFKVND